jgi:hypothetical protein
MGPKKNTQIELPKNGNQYVTEMALQIRREQMDYFKKKKKGMDPIGYGKE